MTEREMKVLKRWAEEAKEAQRQREVARALAIAERDSYINALQLVDDETAGQAVKAFMRYIKTGEVVKGLPREVAQAHDLIAEALSLHEWEC